jgi:hypothetical protein
MSLDRNDTTTVVDQLDGLWGREYPETLPEVVAELPAGTLFTETDDLGRKTPMMKAFHGQVIVGNGAMARGFVYGDSAADGYSIEVTSLQVPAPDDAALEKVAKAILAVGQTAERGYTVEEKVQLLWWGDRRENALEQARAAYAAILGTIEF